MLTIQDINEVSFRKANFSGYNSDDVDQFIDEVLETVTALTREVEKAKAALAAQTPAQRKTSDNAQIQELQARNAELQEKISVLAEKVEAYRQDEDAIKDAILSAQRLGSASIREAKARADATITEANEKAESIVSDARAKSQAVVDSYKAQISQKQEELDSLKRAVTEFRSSLYEMYRQHLGLVEKMPSYPETVTAPKVNAAPAVVPAREPEPEEEEETIPIPAAALHEEEEAELEPAVEEEEPAPEEPETVREPEPEPEPEPISEKDAYIQEQFSGVGIDLNAYADIPETLQKEKETKFSSFDYGIEDEGRRGKFKRR